MAVPLPRRGLRDAQGLFLFLLKWLHSNLYEGFHFRPVAFPVGANGLLSHFGKEKRVVASPLRAAGARSRRWEKRFVLGIERRVCKVQMDFPFNPFPEFP